MRLRTIAREGSTQHLGPKGEGERGCQEFRKKRVKSGLQSLGVACVNSRSLATQLRCVETKIALSRKEDIEA